MRSCCPICCEEFTSKNRKAVPCINTDCVFEACRICTERFLEKTPDGIARCMECRQPWNREHLTNYTSRRFHSKRLREHEANVFLYEERAKLPRTQEMLGARHTILVRKRELERATLDVQNAQHQLGILRDERNRCQSALEEGRRAASINHLLEQQDVPSSRCIAVCPRDGCRGFVMEPSSTCSICKGVVCKHCGVSVGGQTETGHTCNPDMIATMEALRSETKPCPRCYAPIFRISGCDHMWCVICNTPFSWRTQCILPSSEGFHNPHHDAWRDREPVVNLTDQMGCTPGIAVPCVTLEQVNESVNAECSGTTRLHPLAGSVVVAFTIAIRQLYKKMICPYSITPQQRAGVALAKLRIRYLQMEITEAIWVSRIQRVMVKLERNLEIRDLTNTFVYAGHDLLEVILFESSPEIRCDAVASLCRLGACFNKSVKKLHATLKLNTRVGLLPVEIHDARETRPSWCEHHPDFFENIINEERVSKKTKTQKPTTFIPNPGMNLAENRAVTIHPKGRGILFIELSNIYKYY